MSPETAFSASSRSVRTGSLSSSIAALVMTLTSVLVSSIAYVGALSTFTSSFGVLAAYACLVLCLDLIDLMLTVGTFASVYTGMLLKSSFVNAREHTSKS